MRGARTEKKEFEMKVGENVPIFLDLRGDGHFLVGLFHALLNTRYSRWMRSGRSDVSPFQTGKVNCNHYHYNDPLE